MRVFILFFVPLFFLGCSSDEKIRNNYLKKMNAELAGDLVCDYPIDGTLFPPEFPPPSFIWADKNRSSKRWLINVKINQTESIHSEILKTNTWKPEPGVWEKIKSNSVNTPAIISVVGINPEKSKDIYSGGQITISTSIDSVGAPIFYRAVPLPFSFATSHLDSIKYMLGDVSSVQKPKVLLDNLPVCGNCHSFSPDGKSFAMDVDAFGDKGSYLIANVEKEVKMTEENFITWSDFQEKSTMALLSQISPNGKYVVSTLDDNEIFEARDELLYSQLFFPIKGILTTYDVEKKRYTALPGADDTTYVQSNSSWSPDGEHLYFSRAKAVQRSESGMTYGTGIYDLNKFQVLRDSFLRGQKEFKFDLMRIPFNEGLGGEALPIAGASQNNMSNYFPKVSPNGKWMVFCQASNYMLLQPDSKLYIMPTDGSAAPRLMNCNTSEMNSWHSWSPNGRWLVFSSKKMGAYTQLFLTHIDENGNDSPPVWLEYLKVDNRAANIPEFVNTGFDQFNKIIDEFSDVADYNVRGTSKAQFGDFKEAIVDFNKALQVNRNDPQAYANRGKAKDELGDLKGALEDLTKAIELESDESDYYIHRGNTKVKMNDLAGAIEDCNTAIKLKQDDATLYAHRAGIYQLGSAVDKAVEDFSRAIKLDPTYALYFMHRANLYMEQNKYEQAITDIDKAITLEPDNVKFISLKGLFANKHGDTQMAIDNFSRSIQINPRYTMPYLELGVIYEQRNELKVALDYFSKAIEFCDKDERKELASLYNNRGTVYGKMNAYSNAIRDFDKAISYWNNFLDAYSNRAFAKYNIGQLDAALFDCNAALKIDPDFKKAQMVKDMVQKKRMR